MTIIKMGEKKVRISFRPTIKTLYVLKQLGFLDGKGRVKSKWGMLSDFINRRITATYDHSTDFQIESRRFLIVKYQAEIEELKSKIANLGKEICEIKVEA